MRIWLVKIGEPVPIDGNERLMRMGTLGAMLAASGHEVVWWTSTWDHVRKTHRFDQDTIITVQDGYHVRLLHSPGYRQNVSVGRLWDHYVMAKKFARATSKEPRPDVILCALPTPELGQAVARYSAATGVPYVVDVRDLWPDIFLEVVPDWGKAVAKFIGRPIFRAVSEACSGATAVVGITENFVDWGVKYAQRTRTPSDREFPLAYTLTAPRHDLVHQASLFWAQQGIVRDNSEFVACFFGSMSRQFELETVIEAARRLEGQGRPFRFVLCGHGERFESYKKAAVGLSSVVFPGWVGAAEIWSLLRTSKIGLAPYRSSDSFIQSIPNKVIEYMSAGLPVITSLAGVVTDLLERTETGIRYENGDVDGLVRALIDLYDHPERLASLSDNAKQLFNRKFAAEQVYGELICHLERIAEGYQGYGE